MSASMRSLAIRAVRTVAVFSNLIILSQVRNEFWSLNSFCDTALSVVAGLMAYICGEQDEQLRQIW